MFSLQNVSKKYGTKTALSDVSFAAREGEVIGLLGVNGAGKTTTMRLLLGYLTPTSGTVSVFGVNPIERRLEVLSKIGYLPENNPLYPDMKVREYLQFISDIKGEIDWERFGEDVGIADVLEQKIESLSRGYKQRVGLAAALLAEPDLLILDEPTSGLDPIEQDKIKSLIRRVAKKKIVIFSTHILSEVEDVATRLVIIHEGHIVYDGKKPTGRGAVETLFKKHVGAEVKVSKPKAVKRTK